MKKLNIWIAMLFLLTYLGCVSPVIFTAPQPAGAKAQDAFSIFYRGTYLCESDSAIVHLDKHMVYKEKEFPFVLELQTIDTMPDLIMETNTLFIPSQQIRIPYTIKENKIYSSLTIRDTLFRITEDQVLTRFKGHHILNIKNSENKWEVLILSLDDDRNLTLSMAGIPEDLERLKEITPVKDLSHDDIIQFELSPTIFEFNQILEEQLVFKACDYYQRIQLPIDL